MAEIIAARGPKSDVVVTAGMVGEAGLAELLEDGWEPVDRERLAVLIDQALDEMVERVLSFRN